MATITAKNQSIISSGDTNINKLLLSGSYALENGLVCAIIEIVSSPGGIQFSNNEDIDADSRLWITANKFPITFAPDQGIYFKQSANADSFSLSI